MMLGVPSNSVRPRSCFEVPPTPSIRLSSKAPRSGRPTACLARPIPGLCGSVRESPSTIGGELRNWKLFAICPVVARTPPGSPAIRRTSKALLTGPSKLPMPGQDSRTLWVAFQKRNSMEQPIRERGVIGTPGWPTILRQNNGDTSSRGGGTSVRLSSVHPGGMAGISRRSKRSPPGELQDGWPIRPTTDSL